jgi:hypothetical protein
VRTPVCQLLGIEQQIVRTLAETADGISRAHRFTIADETMSADLATARRP